jgi:type II restriction enzyme
MELNLPLDVSKNYLSSSQKIRVITESWVNNRIFCPNCGNNLSNFENNKPVADFYCKKCSEEFELKSKNGIIGKRIVDGAYSSMVKRLRSNNNPNFFFLTYNKNFLVDNFMVIPKYFFVPNIIEKRPPLSVHARRAGWIGCNIVMENIPDLGKIFYVQKGVVNSKDVVLDRWKRTEFIKDTKDVEAKGWMLDVLNCVEKIRKDKFSLEDVYRFESELQIKHPLNNNIQAKIRQQLQFLRDKNFITFIGHGIYKMRNDKS